MEIIKKNFLIIFNCHGNEYLNEFRKSKKFNEIYNSNSIYILLYLKDNLDEFAINLIKNADVLVMQNLKNYRETINNDIIFDLIKKECKVLLLPHYVFSGYHINYFLPDNFTQDKTDNELKKIINNFSINNEIIFSNLNNSLEEVKNLELSFDCAISMYDELKENYKKIRLFNSRSYPTNMFFNIASKKILKILNIYDDIEYFDNNFASSDRHPILPIVGKTLNLQFDYLEDIRYNNIKINYIHYLLLNKIKNNYNLLLWNTDNVEKIELIKNRHNIKIN
jgi:hypothetical protein